MIINKIFNTKTFWTHDGSQVSDEEVFFRLSTDGLNIFLFNYYESKFIIFLMYFGIINLAKYIAMKRYYSHTVVIKHNIWINSE